MATRRGRKSVAKTGHTDKPNNGDTPNATTIDLTGFEQFEPAPIAESTGGTEPTGEPAGNDSSSEGTTTEPARRRRGRPAGSGIGKKKEVLQDLNSLETILLSIHNMGAAFLDTEELQLEPAEAAEMAAAIERVRRLYPTEFNPKIMAWVNLSIVMGGAYGVRFMAIRARHKRERLAKRGQLHEMPKPAAPPPAQPAAATGTDHAAPVQDEMILMPSQLSNRPFSDEPE